MQIVIDNIVLSLGLDILFVVVYGWKSVLILTCCIRIGCLIVKAVVCQMIYWQSCKMMTLPMFLGSPTVNNRYQIASYDN